MRLQQLIPLLAAILSVMILPACQKTNQTLEVKVGSKKFTESVILGELVARLTESTGAHAIHENRTGRDTGAVEGITKGEHRCLS